MCGASTWATRPVTCESVKKWVAVIVPPLPA